MAEVVADSGVVVPSSKSDRVEFKTKIVEITNSYARIDAEKDHIKTILGEVQEKFSVKKKMVSKIARTMYKTAYNTVQQENEDFTTLYETIIEGKSEA